MPDASDRIAALIRQGKKIEAIKLLRETTGVSLKRAKAEIDRLEADLNQSAGTTPPSASTSDGRGRAVQQDVEALVQQGRRIEAIKLLRESTGLGLKEAKAQIDAMGGNRSSGCLSAIALLATAGLVIIGAFAGFSG